MEQIKVNARAVRIDHEEVIEEFKRRKAESDRHQRFYREEARRLNDLRAGHQITEEQKLELRNRYGGGYPEIEFNVMDPHCDAVCGVQINNRQEVRFYPREEGDAGVDEMATGVVKWCRDQSEAEDEESDAFCDLFLTGVGCIEHFLEDEEDPTSQYIGQERRDPIEMGWDPMARKKNLTDRRYQFRLKPFSKDEFEEKFGENYEGGGYDAPDALLTQHVTRPEDYDQEDNGGSTLPQPIYVADYQFMRLQTQWKVTANMVDPQTGQAALMTQLMSSGEWRVVRPALIAAGLTERSEDTPEDGQWYEAERVAKKCYYRAWLCGERILGKVYELKCGFTYEFMTGKRDRNINLWYGIGRGLVSPQMWMNKFFATILYTLMVNAKGGIMAEEDAFEDQAEAERTWANPASITFLKEGALAKGKIQPKPQSPYPQGMDRLMEFTLRMLPQVTGLNPEILGLADRQQPGVLEAQRKQAALAIIAWVFDAMRRYYKRSGKLMLSMIREYLPENQLIRIMGDSGAKYVPLVKDQMTARYDVIPEESPTSVNVQERTWLALREAGPIAAGMGAPPPPSAVKYIPGLPEDFKQEWLKSIKSQMEDPQKQQQAQEAQALQKASIAAKTAKDQTQAQLNAAKAQQTQIEAGLTAKLQPISEALANMSQAQQIAQQQAQTPEQQPGASFQVPQAQAIEPPNMLQ